MNKAPKTDPTTVPTAIVATASVNLAFSFPTNALPDNQRTGESMMMFTMMLIISAFRSIAKTTLPVSDLNEQ